mmetsp:Transcript_29862/g.65617  ORF Transcript_29862/g.65617 Transcript_29862/m.65617 type:complete len:265 (-) Transcript_29862:1701-2495(-)
MAGRAVNNLVEPVLQSTSKPAAHAPEALLQRPPHHGVTSEKLQALGQQLLKRFLSSKQRGVFGLQALVAALLLVCQLLGSFHTGGGSALLLLGQYPKHFQFVPQLAPVLVELVNALLGTLHLGRVAVGEEPRALLQFLRLLRVALELPSNLFKLGLQRRDLLCLGYTLHIHVGFAARQVQKMTGLLLQRLGDFVHRRTFRPSECFPLDRRFLLRNLSCSCHFLVGKLDPVRCSLWRLDTLDWVVYGIVDDHPQHLFEYCSLDLR